MEPIPSNAMEKFAHFGVWMSSTSIDHVGDDILDKKELCRSFLIFFLLYGLITLVNT